MAAVTICSDFGAQKMKPLAVAHFSLVLSGVPSSGYDSFFIL